MTDAVRQHGAPLWRQRLTRGGLTRGLVPTMHGHHSRSETRRNRLITIGILTLALAFPFIDGVLGLGMLNPSLRILTSVMLALGLNIVVGFAGLLDLGYVAFWAIGAYVVGWFASTHFDSVSIHIFSGADMSMPGVHVSIWLLFFVALFFAAVLGVLIGAPTLRLSGDYLAIVTLGFGEILPKIFQNGDSLFGYNVTNGVRGISGLDQPSLGGPAVDAIAGPGWGTWGPINLLPWYYLGLALVGVCIWVSMRLQWARLGRAWVAIREDEVAASAMGINLVQTKLWAYGIGASLGGLAGVYHGTRIGSIFPTSFQFYISIAVLCMVIVGGMGNIWGAVLGAVAIEGLNFWLLPNMGVWAAGVGLDIDLASWNLFIFGALLVGMMIYRPQGFLPARAREHDLEQHKPTGRYRQVRGAPPDPDGGPGTGMPMHDAVHPANEAGAHPADGSAIQQAIDHPGPQRPGVQPPATGGAHG